MIVDLFEIKYRYIKNIVDNRKQLIDDLQIELSQYAEVVDHKTQKITTNALTTSLKAQICNLKSYYRLDRNERSRKSTP